MAWIKTLPDGDLGIEQGDDAIRTNNDAVELALDAEHYFATGGSQTGRHKFGVGTTAARNALTAQQGMIWYNTDVYAGHVCVQIYNAAAWVNIDVFQTNLFRTDAQTRSTVPQYADWLNVAVTGAGPYLVACDFLTSPRKYCTLTQNVTLSNPVNDLGAGVASADVLFDFIQDGTGGRTITFSNKYFSPDGLRPIVSTVAGARTRLYISGTQNGNYLVTSVPNMVVIV
jgi:hypothetical protein